MFEESKTRKLTPIYQSVKVSKTLKPILFLAKLSVWKSNEDYEIG